MPWPLPGSSGPVDDDVELGETELWLAGLWTDVLGVRVAHPDADFFAEGGGSLAAAQLVTAIRERHPDVSVADLYDHPRLGSMAEMLDARTPTTNVRERRVSPTPRAAGIAQLALSAPLPNPDGPAAGRPGSAS